MVAPILGDSYINRIGSTLSLATGLGQLEVTVCTPRIVRVRLAPDGRPAPPSYLAPRAWPPVDFAVRPAIGPSARSAIDTGSLVVQVETNPVCLAFGDSSGHVMDGGHRAAGLCGFAGIRSLGHASASSRVREAVSARQTIVKKQFY